VCLCSYAYSTGGDSGRWRQHVYLYVRVAKPAIRADYVPMLLPEA
jgi:hypothetical protein